MTRKQYAQRFLFAARKYLRDPSEANWKRLVDLAAQMQIAESVS